jgi:hypothetical protein
MLLLASCGTRQSSEIQPIGPDVGYDLVIYFKDGTTRDQIEEFWETVLATRGETGHDLSPGIRSVLRVAPVQGHEAVAVSFSSNATPTERQDVKNRVTNSPIVYRVMENVKPDDVKKID